jgi:hypothetical protein
MLSAERVLCQVLKWVNTHTIVTGHLAAFNRFIYDEPCLEHELAVFIANCLEFLKEGPIRIVEGGDWFKMKTPREKSKI